MTSRSIYSPLKCTCNVNAKIYYLGKDENLYSLLQTEHLKRRNEEKKRSQVTTKKKFERDCNILTDCSALGQMNGLSILVT